MQLAIDTMEGRGVVKYPVSFIALVGVDNAGSYQLHLWGVGIVYDRWCTTWSCIKEQSLCSQQNYDWRTPLYKCCCNNNPITSRSHLADESIHRLVNRGHVKTSAGLSQQCGPHESVCIGLTASRVRAFPSAILFAGPGSISIHSIHTVHLYFLAHVVVELQGREGHTRTHLWFGALDCRRVMNFRSVKLPDRTEQYHKHLLINSGP